MLGRELGELGRAVPLRDDPEEPKLGRRTLLVRLGAALGRLLGDRALLGVALGRALGGRLIEYFELPIEAGRRTLLLRDGFTRGWLTIELLGFDRGTELVSVRPDPVRPTTLV